MLKNISVMQWFAGLAALQFFVIVSIGHVPGFTDAQGNLFGFYHVSPLIDGGHFLSGVFALIAALCSARWSMYYFRLVAIPYGLDFMVSFLFGRDVTETGSIFTLGVGSPDFSFHNLVANSPHIGLVAVALILGYWLGPRLKNKTPRALFAK